MNYYKSNYNEIEVIGRGHTGNFYSNILKFK